MKRFVRDYSEQLHVYKQDNLENGHILWGKTTKTDCFDETGNLKKPIVSRDQKQNKRISDQI
jgi:hypothetical protein